MPNVSFLRMAGGEICPARQPVRSEHMGYREPRIHYPRGKSGWSICGQYGVLQVCDWNKITCKTCLKIKKTPKTKSTRRWYKYDKAKTIRLLGRAPEAYLTIHSGVFLLTDPASTLFNPAAVGKNWNEFIKILVDSSKKADTSQIGTDSPAAFVRPGRYPVFILRGPSGRIERILIDFFQEDKNDEI